MLARRCLDLVKQASLGVASTAQDCRALTSAGVEAMKMAEVLTGGVSDRVAHPKTDEPVASLEAIERGLRAASKQGGCRMKMAIELRLIQFFGAMPARAKRRFECRRRAEGERSHAGSATCDEWVWALTVPVVPAATAIDDAQHLGPRRGGGSDGPSAARRPPPRGSGLCPGLLTDPMAC